MTFSDDTQATITDPVCNTAVDPSQTGQAYRHGDRFFYFCSTGCLKKFAADPDAFRPRQARADAPA